MNLGVVLAACSFVAGGLLVMQGYLLGRRPTLQSRLAFAESREDSGELDWGDRLPGWLLEVRRRYERQLRRAGGAKTLPRLILEKLLLAFAGPVVPLLPYSAATGRAPNLLLVALFAVAGFFVPELILHGEAKRRREAIFLDLPEAIAILALALRAGQSLRQALELAASDSGGPLGEELQRALTIARRERGVDERQALVRVARAADEPTFARFAELLAAKESPYLDFLRQQTREVRAEQNRYLERAADRAYLSMHAPLAPLLAVLVLVLAYGFLRFLSHTV